MIKCEKINILPVKGMKIHVSPGRKSGGGAESLGNEGATMRLSEKISNAAGKMSPRKLILICAFLAIMIFIILYSSLSALVGNKEPEPEKKVEGKPVISAALDIAEYTVITDDMLEVKMVPEDLVPPGALTDKSMVVGQSAGVKILLGDVITNRKLGNVGSQGFKALIPKGMRALSFAVNDITGVAGFAKPGDRVDILLVANQTEKDRITSKLLLKDVLLLAINKSSMAPQQTVRKGENGEAKIEVNASSSGTPSVATVALTPYDAAKLTASLQVGQLQLMLRPENQRSATDSVAYYAIPVPKAETPAPAYSTPQQQGAAPTPTVSVYSTPANSGIEVIRGTNVSRGN